MLHTSRTAVKFLVYGLVIGLLFAPKSGEENRKDLVNWITGTVKNTLNTGT
jgi:gas vesicle protein